MDDLTKILLKIGLSDKESSVYAKLLELGSQPIGVISKHTAINRSTCYSIINSLVEKGLVSKYTKMGVMFFTALPLNKLPGYLEERKNNLDVMIEEINEIEKLQKTNENLKNKTTVSYFEGMEGLKQIYEDTLEENTTIKTIVGLDEITDELNSYLSNVYLKKRKNLNVSVDAVISENKHNLIYEGSDKEQLRKKKTIKFDDDFTTQISIYKNKVAFVNFLDGNYKGVIIEDSEIAKNIEMIFDLLKKL